MKSKVFVSIIEDDKVYREGLENLIEKSDYFTVLHSYSSAEEAMPHLIQIPPEIAIVDIKLPGKNGIDLISEIKLHAPDVLCMICSFYDDNEYLFSALRNGASGYILKDSMPHEIIDSLRELHNGGSPMSRFIAKKIIAKFQLEKNQPGLSELTERENQILGMLSTGLAIKEIAVRLYISVQTVTKHLKNIYTKLHVSNRTDAIKRIKNSNPSMSVPRFKSKDSGGQSFSIEQLQQLYKTSISILDYISHDLRRETAILFQLLNSIIGETKIRPTHNSLDRINSYATKMLSVANTMNSISAQIQSNSNSIDSATELGDAFISYPYKIIQGIISKNKSIEIKTAASSLSVQIVFPKAILSAIYLELIANAMRNGGTKIVIKWQVLGEVFQCEVHDNGTGFDELKIRHFVTLSAVVVKKTHVLEGMGLKIIEQTITNSHGNLFFANSDIMKGALVYFELPVTVGIKK